MGVVIINRCIYCGCDPCDCDWGINELVEERTADLIQVDEKQCDGDGGVSFTPTIPDFSSIYDCISDFSGYPRDRTYRRHNSNLIGTIAIFKIGDLVRWYPVHGFSRPKKVWIIKQILNPNLMDSGWYDYELTDGVESHMATKYELFKLKEGEDE